MKYMGVAYLKDEWIRDGEVMATWEEAAQAIWINEEEGEVLWVRVYDDAMNLLRLETFEEREDSDGLYYAIVDVKVVQPETLTCDVEKLRELFVAWHEDDDVDEVKASDYARRLIERMREEASAKLNDLKKGGRS